MSSSTRPSRSRMRDVTRNHSGGTSPHCFSWNIFTIILFLSLTFTSNTHVDAFLLSRLNQSSVAVPSPYFSFGLTEFEVEGELVRAVPPDACKVIPKDIAEGKLLWVEPGYCSIETKIHNCQLSGCLGAVSFSAYRVPGLEMWTSWERRQDSALAVPFVQVGREEAEWIRNAIIEHELHASRYRSVIPVSRNSTDFKAYISSADSPNAWKEAFESLYFTMFFQIGLGICHIMVVLVAMHKFHRYWQLRLVRPQFSLIPLVCLFLCILSLMERGLYCFIDPMGAKQIIPRPYRRVLLTISVPWTYAATLLLTFFWSEAIANHRKLCAAEKKQLQAAKEQQKEQLKDHACRPYSTQKETSNDPSQHEISVAALATSDDDIEMSVLPIVEEQNHKSFQLNQPRQNKQLQSYRSQSLFLNEEENDLYAIQLQLEPESVPVTSVLAGKSELPQPDSTLPLNSPASKAPEVALPLSTENNESQAAGMIIVHLDDEVAEDRDDEKKQVQESVSPSCVNKTQAVEQRSFPVVPVTAVATTTVAVATMSHTFTPKSNTTSLSSTSSTTTSKSIDSPNQFLAKYKKLFIISSAFLAALDLTVSILDSIYMLDWQCQPIVQLLFASIGACIAFCYFWVAFLVIRQFQLDAQRKSASTPKAGSQDDTLSMDSWTLQKLNNYRLKTQKDSRSKILRMTQFIVLSGIGLCLYLAVSAATPWSAAAWDDPFTTISKDFLLFVALFIVSTCQVCAF